MRYLPSRVAIVVLLIVSSTALLSVSPGARVVEYFGYDDSIELFNDDCTVMLTPAVGGKVMSYKLNGKEALHIIPEEAGFHYDPNSEVTIRGAGRFDFGLERRVPPRPELWLGPWKGEIIGRRKATLTSPPHEATGVQVVREFTLADKGSHLSCKQTLINISNRTLSYSHWGRTFAQGLGIVVIPLSEWSRYKNHYVMMEPEDMANLAPDNPTINIRDNALVITGAPEHPKLAMDSMEGWFSYLMPNDLMFIKQYPVFPDRNYAERVPMTISIWYVENYRNELTVTELEPIGPLEIMAPGERSSFTEEWYLVDHAFPENRDDFDVQSILEVSKKVLNLP